MRNQSPVLIGVIAAGCGVVAVLLSVAFTHGVATRSAPVAADGSGLTPATAIPSPTVSPSPTPAPAVAYGSRTSTVAARTAAPASPPVDELPDGSGMNAAKKAINQSPEQPSQPSSGG